MYEYLPASHEGVALLIGSTGIEVISHESVTIQGWAQVLAMMQEGVLYAHEPACAYFPLSEK